jgi:Carboxypeptidase regulatory-like domain
MRRLLLGVLLGGVGLLAMLAIRERGAGGVARARQRIGLEERAVFEVAANESPGSELNGAPRVAQPAARAGVARLVTLAGRVFDEHGGPVEDVSVIARGVQRSSGPAHAEQRTDQEGRFRFTGLAAGVWRLEADSSALAAGARRSVDASAGDVEAELKVLRGHVLVLRARWADGSPVHSIRVIILELDAGRELEREALPRSLAGEFELRGVKEGVHLVRVGAKHEDRDVDAYQYVTVPAAEPLEFVLPVPDLVLRGTVLDVEGHPVEGARVASGLRGSTVQVAPDGSFELRGLPSRRTSLSASAPGYHGESVEVDVRAGHPDVQLLLVRLARIRGHVIDPSGQPFPGARIADSFERGANYVASDHEGRFELELSPGHHFLRAMGGGHADGEELGLTLAPGEEREGFVLRLRPACRVVGRVLDADGQPVHEAYVSALFESVLTAEDGGFVFETCPPDPIRVTTFDDGCRVWAEVTPTQDAATSVELRLERRDPVLLHVRITHDAQPLRASLVLRSGPFSREGTLDGDGRLSVAVQRPGRWRGLLTPEGALQIPAELASLRQVEFTVPDLESWSFELDWNALTQPLGIEEVWSLLYD